MLNGENNSSESQTKKLTLNTKLENNSSGSQTKKLTLNAKLRKIIALEAKPKS